MRCAKCENNVEDDWAVCPMCGNALPKKNEKQQIEIRDSVVKGDIQVVDSRDFSTHTTNHNTNITNVGQQITGSTVHFHSSPSNTEQAATTTRQAIDALIAGADCRDAFRKACELDPAAHEPKLMLGVSILATPIKNQNHRTIGEADNALQFALQNEETKAAASYAMAAIRHCFYMDHSGNPPEPDFETLRSWYDNCTPPTPIHEQALKRLAVCAEFEVDWILASQT